MTDHVEVNLGEGKPSSGPGSYRFRADPGRRPPPRSGHGSGTQTEGTGRFRNARRSENLPSRRLLFSMVGVSFVLPLGVTVALGVTWLRHSLDPFAEDLSRARDHLSFEPAGMTLRAHAVHAANGLDAFFLERLLDARSLASTPSLVSAAKRAGTEHQSRGYADLTIDPAEVRMGSVRSLGLFPEADLHLLHHLSSNPFFLEASVTDRFGFNVAMTHSAPDFVQRDEPWWQDAWTRGLHVGDVEYDRRTRELSTVVGLLIEDPVSGERLGVLKVLLGVDHVRSLMDSTVESVSGIAISVFTRGGKAVADTVSGHAPGRIMAEGHAPIAISPGTRAGFVPDGESLVGFSRTAGRSGYLPLRSDFGGLGWLVQIQGRPDGRLPTYESFDEVLRRTREWPWHVGVAGAAGGLTALALCLAVVWLLVRRLSAAISASRGELRTAAIPHPVHRR